MKKFLLCLLVFLLCACSNIDGNLDSIFNNTEVGNIRANNYTDYIEYYMPSDVNEESSESLSFVFNTDGEKFIMNINITNILNKEYYDKTKLVDDGFFDQNKITYENNGSFTNINDEIISFFIKVYDYENESVLYLVTNEVTMYGICPKDKVCLLASKMFNMAMASNVINDKIIADYSQKDVIDYQKATVNLFENVYPESGRVDDLLTEDAKVPE